MGKYIISDKYGYWEEVEATSPSEAIRISSNLNDEASLDYASSSYVDESANITEDQIERNNCIVAMYIGNMQCQCGHHRN